MTIETPEQRVERWTRAIASVIGPRCRENLDAADALETLTARIAELEAQLAGAVEALEVVNHENGSLKAIVQGWHYLAVGPDEMGDYYTHKQLVKASEPYASPALRALATQQEDSAMLAVAQGEG